MISNQAPLLFSGTSNRQLAEEIAKRMQTRVGNALVDHARGITPPAEIAFRRAEQVTPGYPGPKFFYGLALARSGDRQGALAMWQSILKTAPKGAQWRPLVEQGVLALSEKPRPGAP